MPVIEDISGEKTARQAVGQGKNDRVELTALRFMYRDRVGKLKLVQHIERVGRQGGHRSARSGIPAADRCARARPRLR